MKGRVSFRIRREGSAGHTRGVTALALAVDGKSLFSSSRDCTVRGWDLSSPPSQSFAVCGHQHFVNGIALASPDRLVSCSSDGSLCVWDLASSSPTAAPRPVASLWGHRDCVTAVCVPETQREKVLSAGLDGTVREWDLTRLPAAASPGLLTPMLIFKPKPPPPPPEKTETVADAAPAPAAAPAAPAAAKQPDPMPAKPQSRFSFWSFFRSDIPTEAPAKKPAEPIPPLQLQTLLPQPQPQPPGVTEVEALERALFCRGPFRTSLYSVAFGGADGTVFSGAFDGKVFAWDPRVGYGDIDSQLFSLEGHREAVRSIVAFDDSPLLATGSSDSGIAIWDLRQRKRISEVLVHSRGVSCLARTADGFFSCGRDGRVFSFNLRSPGSATPVVDLRRPLLSITVHGTTCWIGSDDGSIVSWDARVTATAKVACSDFMECKEPEPEPKPKPEPEPTQPTSTQQKAEGSQAEAKPQPNPDEQKKQKPEATMEVEEEPLPPPPLQGPELEQRFSQPRFGGSDRPCEGVDSSKLITVIPAGHAAIVKFAVLNDKLRILTRDSSGMVALFDVLRCRQVESFGTIDFDEKLKELQPAISRSNWFSVTVHAGELDVWLEPPSCFHTELRTCDLGLGGEDLVNLGSVMLGNLFGVKAESDEPRWRGEKACCFELPPGLLVFQTQRPRDVTSAVGHAQVSTTSDLRAATVSTTTPGLEHILIPWVRTNLETGETLPDEQMPKLGLVAVCSDPKKAPRKDRKGIHIRCDMATRGVDVSRLIAERHRNPGIKISLSCKKQPIPPEMTIATAKAFIWRSPGEMKVEYTCETTAGQEEEKQGDEDEETH